MVLSMCWLPSGRGFHGYAMSSLTAAMQVINQHGVDGLEQTGIAPGVKVAPHRRHRREAFGQESPRAPTRGYIKQSVEDFAHVCRSRSASTPCRRHEWLCQRPLRIRHIRWISQSLPAMLAPGNTSPCHHSLHLFAKRRESQHAGIAQQLSVRALSGWALNV